MLNLINQNEFILMEGAVVERIRRNPEVDLDPLLVNAPLIYSEFGRAALKEIYDEYIEVARAADVPFVMVTPTWRCNHERVSSKFPAEINRHCVDFLKSIRESYGSYGDSIKIGGMVGCKNDCYKPEQSLSSAEAEQFHRWQVEQLTDAGVDFLIGETLPALEEAKGIARLFDKTNLDYILSFCISSNGSVLDGNSLETCIKTIDSSSKSLASGYAVNCAYPTFLNIEKQPNEVLERVVGFMGNASSMDQNELDGAEVIHQESREKWSDDMKILYNNGIKMLGGCCGTDAEFLKKLVEKVRQ